MKNIFCYSICTLGVLIFSTAVFADDEAREPAAVHASDKAQLRQYPGGRDEQDIKVQSSLPQPPKNIDGAAVGEMTVPDDHD